MNPVSSIDSKNRAQTIAEGKAGGRIEQAEREEAKTTEAGPVSLSLSPFGVAEESSDCTSGRIGR